MVRVTNGTVALGIAVAAAILSAGTTPASAQGDRPAGGGGPVYVPFAGSFGGFVPYSPGPAGGLGVQPGTGRTAGRAATPRLDAPTGAVGMGTRPELGALRTMLPPLSPPVPPGMGARAWGGLIRRPRGGGMTGGTGRPPVGAYPFRQPTRLDGAGSPTMDR